MQTMFEDRPKLVVSGHFGNFSGGIYFGVGFEPNHARPLDNRFLDQFIREFRTIRGRHLRKMAAGEIAELLESAQRWQALMNVAPVKGVLGRFF
jgi:lauroyl/myristoyl acyltransferase